MVHHRNYHWNRLSPTAPIGACSRRIEPLDTKDEYAYRRRYIRKEILRQMTLTDASGDETDELEQVLENLSAAVDTGMYPDGDPAGTIRFHSKSFLRRAVDLLEFANVAEAMRSLPPVPPGAKKTNAEVQTVAAE